MNLQYIIHNHICEFFIISLFSLLSFKVMMNFNMDGINRNYKHGQASDNIKKQKFKTTKIYSAIRGDYFLIFLKNSL